MPSLKRTPAFSYFELLDLCQEPGCPLCHLAQKTVDRAIIIMFDDGGVTDVDVRLQLRRSLGYCREHAHYLIDPRRTGSRSPLGMSIVYGDILKAVTRKLDETRFTPRKELPLDKQVQSQVNTWFNRPKKQPNTTAAVDALQPDEKCPICARRDNAIILATDTLVTRLAEEDAKLIAALEQSDPICLPHLGLALAYAKTPGAVKQLKRITTAHLDQLRTELEEFQRKQDYRYQDETLTDAERDAWQRAVRFVVGAGK